MNRLSMQNILDHFKDPDNSGVLDNYNFDYELKNLSCGDSIHVYLLVEDNIIKDVSFEGAGCAISQASMSMLSEEIKGIPLDEFHKIDSNFIKEMLQIELGPTRLKCATLGLETIRKCFK